MPLEEHGLKRTIKTGIEMSTLLTEWEAAHAANLDLFKWETDEYPSSFKAKVMGWYSRHTELELHRQDAVARSANRK